MPLKIDEIGEPFGTFNYLPVAIINQTVRLTVSTSSGVSQSYELFPDTTHQNVCIIQNQVSNALHMAAGNSSVQIKYDKDRHYVTFSLPDNEFYQYSGNKI